MLWLLKHTEKFPKSERFRLAKMVNNSVIEFHHQLLCLAYEGEREEYFTKADIELAKMRVYFRMCHEMSLSSIRQYEYFSSLTTEIGKLLGGWKKKAA